MHIYNPIAVDDEEQRGNMVKAFAKNIRRIRLKKKMTQEQVAEMAGINPKYLGEIERGLKSPTAVVVGNLSKALGVPVCSILSTSCCPYDDNDISCKVGKLLVGKDKQEVRKAVRILEVFFE